MTEAPIALVLGVATGGAASEAADATTGIVKSITAAAAKAVPVQVQTAYRTLQAQIRLGERLTDLVGGEESLQALLGIRATASNSLKVATNGRRAMDAYDKAFVDNFSAMTSPAIDAVIDQKFTPAAAHQIKQIWAVHYAILSLQGEKLLPATIVLTNASAITGQVQATAKVVGSAATTMTYGAGIISGITGVAAAYVHPICSNSAPFPAINPLY